MITNSKMADKMAEMQGYGCMSSVYISFQVLQHIAFRHMPASMLGFLVAASHSMPFMEYVVHVIITCVVPVRLASAMPVCLLFL